MTRSTLITKQSSEKIVLAHVEANQRVFNWTLNSPNVFRKTTAFFVVGLKVETTVLTKVSALVSVVEGTFFFDTQTSTLFAHVSGGVDPSTVETIATYRFFFSSAPVTVSWDLTDLGDHVAYDARIKSIPGFKHKIGIEQGLSSLVGTGDLKLENGDGGLDEIFDTLYFENRQVAIYNWFRDLPFSDAKIIFRGRVTNKTFNAKEISFKVKDSIFDLQQSMPMTAYDDTDDVASTIKGRFKRWIYGRADGVQIQSIEQIGDGYEITGTATGTNIDATLTGTGTLFLSELSPDDELTIGTQTFTVDSIQSDTSLTLNDTPDFGFVDFTVSVKPSIATTIKNRNFIVAGHACTELTKTLIKIKQFNRVELSDTLNLSPGEFLEFDTGERIEIRNLAPDNTAVLVKSLTTTPTLSSDVIRQPVQTLYLQGTPVDDNQFTISNLGDPTDELKIILDSNIEFNLARTTDVNLTFTFTNGSRNVTFAGTETLSEILKPRDFIRPRDLTFTTFYEILQVNDTSLDLRVVFADPNKTDLIEAKFPEYVGDTTIVSADTFGRTEDGEPDGVWITTGAQVNRDVLRQLNVTEVNETSFTQGEILNTQLISLTLPTTPAGALPTGKLVTDLINKSLFSAMTFDNDLKVKYVNSIFAVNDPIVIRDQDVVAWTIKTSNGKAFRNSFVNYRFVDVDKSTLEPGNKTFSFSSDFVEQYIETNKSDESDVFIYNDTDAEIYSHRNVYFNRLSRSDITINTDLRFEDIEIGEVVAVDFDRLFKRLGDPTSRRKLVMVIGKNVTGERVQLELSDFGNIFNQTSIITENTAPDFASSTSEDKIVNGYITDNNGITDDDETTVNIHLIT